MTPTWGLSIFLWGLSSAISMFLAVQIITGNWALSYFVAASLYCAYNGLALSLHRK